MGIGSGFLTLPIWKHFLSARGGLCWSAGASWATREKLKRGTRHPSSVVGVGVFILFLSVRTVQVRLTH